FSNRLAGYDPLSGKELWTSQGVGGTIYTTPVWGGGTVLAMSGGMMGSSALAVRTGGTGDVTESRRLWRQDRVKSRIGSGVIDGDYFYTVTDNGIAECLELKTGRKIWEEQLQGPVRKTSSWSSMLLAED